MFKKLIKYYSKKLKRADEEQRFKSRVSLSLSVIFFVLYAVFTPIVNSVGELKTEVITQIYTTLALIIVAISSNLKWPERNIAPNFILFALLTSTLPSVYYNGAFNAPIYALTILLPTLAAILIGKRASIIYFLICLGTSGAIFLMILQNKISITPFYDELTMQKRRVIIYSALLFVSLLVGLIYDRFRKKMHLATLNKNNLKKRLSELEGARSIVTTYHHHLNTPLTIANGYIQKLHRSFNKIDKNLDVATSSEIADHFKKATESLQEIEATLKLIDQACNSEALEIERYSNDIKLYKIKQAIKSR